MNLPSVTPEQFGARLNNALAILIKALGQVVAPIATIGIIISAIVIIVGSMIHSKELKKFGYGGIAAVAGGLLIYLGTPLIVGLIRAMGDALR